MGRIVISNKREWVEDIEKAQTNVGLRLSAKISGATDVLVFHKLKVDNYNYYQSENSGQIDYIATSGTLIYDGRFGIDALPQMLNDLKTLSVKEVRSRIMGNYFVLYRINGVLSGFTDEMGDCIICRLIPRTYAYMKRIKAQLKQKYERLY